MNATTELLSDDLVRVRLSRPPHFHWSAGQTAYLVMPSVSTLPFEVHPSTIASFDSSLLSTTTQETQFLGSSTPLWKDLVFLINVHEGFTKKLNEVTAGKGPVKVFIDGPYGLSPDLGCYDTSVLVAGGSGVSYTLPVLLNIIECVRSGKSSCNRVVFIWSIRDAAHVQWIEEALIRAVQLASPLTVSIRIFVTGAAKAQINLSSEDFLALSTSPEKNNAPAHIVMEADSSPSLLGGVELNNRRLNLDALLKEEISITSGRMLVSVCGSQGVARATAMHFASL